MSSSRPSGTSTSVVSSNPWSGVQPYLTKGFEAAESNILDNPIQPYPNSRVVPFANQTTQGLGLAETRANVGSPYLDAAQRHMMGVASGDYLNQNQYLDAAVDAAARPVMRNYNDAVLPGINAIFGGRGRYGSGLHMRAQEGAQENLARTLADLSGTMAYKGYEDERGRMMSASAAAPQMAAADYADAAELERIGAVYEGQAGANLQDDISRYLEEQTGARDAAKEYMAMIQGGTYGGSQTTSQPIYRNRAAEGLGAAAQIAGIGGSLFGGQGIFPGFKMP